MSEKRFVINEDGELEEIGQTYTWEEISEMVAEYPTLKRDADAALREGIAARADKQKLLGERTKIVTYLDDLRQSRKPKPDYQLLVSFLGDYLRGDYRENTAGVSAEARWGIKL